MLLMGVLERRQCWLMAHNTMAKSIVSYTVEIHIQKRQYTLSSALKRKQTSSGVMTLAAIVLQR
jgi:hypothetical protein